jgi:hypothetical protein
MQNILFCLISDAFTVRSYKEDRVLYVKIKIFSHIRMAVWVEKRSVFKTELLLT